MSAPRVPRRGASPELVLERHRVLLALHGEVAESNHRIGISLKRAQVRKWRSRRRVLLALHHEVAESRSKVQGPPGPRGAPGRSAALENVHFDAKASAVRPKCQDKIDLVAAWARQHPGERFMLQGFVEPSEGVVPDRGLAERRARAVRDALVAAGVDPSRIDVVKMVGIEPVCAQRSEQWRELNRRVEIAVIDPRAGVLSLAAIDPERFPRGASAP